MNTCHVFEWRPQIFAAMRYVSVSQICSMSYMPSLLDEPHGNINKVNELTSHKVSFLIVMDHNNRLSALATLTPSVVACLDG